MITENKNSSVANCGSCLLYSECDDELKGSSICGKYKTKINTEHDIKEKLVRFHCVVNDKTSSWFKPWEPSDPPENLEEIAEQLEVRPKDIFASAINDPYIAEAKAPIIEESSSLEDKLEKLKEDIGEAKNVSQADKLIKLCLLHNPVLFQDQHQTAYVKTQQSSIHVNLKIRSKFFKSWLANLLWQYEEKAPGTEALYSAINVLESKARYEGEKHTLYNRVAPAEDGFWLDMVDERWRAIKVTADGWHIVDDPPILFKRFSHQKPLTTPLPGGDPWRLLDFINLDKKDMDTRLTLLCAAISCLIPSIPHPIIVTYGIQGSGKTWLFRLIRSIVDPSIMEVLTLPRNERERVQQLDHHWCAFYDNVTKLPPWMSDTLCRAATGGGFSKRELYTDDSDITYSFKRCVGLNGINIAAQRGDLLDRSLLIGLQDIPRTKRRTEKQLLAEFEECKAEILGGFLDTLVKAIRIYPSVKPKRLFRMADFTRWGCAIAIALGHTEQDFIDAYETKVKMQIEEAALSSPVATVLIDLMEKVGNWDTTPAQLWRALVNNAKELGLSIRQKAWPKAPNALVRQLNELTPSLKALGWEVVTGVKAGQGKDRTRRILINSVRPSQPSQPLMKRTIRTLRTIVSYLLLGNQRLNKMPSKRERRKQEKRWFKFLEAHGDAISLRLSSLMVEEMLYEKRVRMKAIRLARKRKPEDYIR